MAINDCWDYNVDCFKTYQKVYEEKRYALLDRYMLLCNFYSLNDCLKSTFLEKKGVQLICPHPDVVENLARICQLVLQPWILKNIRPSGGYFIPYITSGYRSEYLNSSVGGVKNSLHLKGRAVDIWTRNFPTLELLNNFIVYLRSLNFLTELQINEQKHYIHIGL